MKPIFITGIGTGVGKTVISAIVTEALQADYWKPIQAGFDDGTDSETVRSLLSNSHTVIHPESYKLSLPASPHISGREENVTISIDKIVEDFNHIKATSAADYIVIEGAGGLLVPINDNQFILDLIKALDAYVILVSQNYLGSINHSLLTAQVCKSNNLKVLGLIFNGEYMNYQQEIVGWSGYPFLGAIPTFNNLSRECMQQHAVNIRQTVISRINNEETGA
jgi:dethiobiotin synthetase